MINCRIYIAKFCWLTSLALLLAAGTACTNASDNSSATADKGMSPAPVIQPSIVPNQGGPPPSLWLATMAKTLVKSKPNSNSWAPVPTASLEYSFQAPLSLAIGTPSGFDDTQAFMLTPANDPYTRFFVIPWSIYDQKLESEIDKCLSAWLLSSDVLQSATLTGESFFTIADKPAVERKYSIILAGNENEWQARATFVEARPRCYAVIMLTLESQANSLETVYNKICDSLMLRLTPAAVKPNAQQQPKPQKPIPPASVTPAPARPITPSASPVNSASQPAASALTNQPKAPLTDGPKPNK